MDLSLVMFKTDGTRRDFSVTKDRVVIGRKPTCDLRIPLSSVSRQHCEIELDGDVALLRDLGSSNGTFHNSVRIQEQELAAGDEVTIGPVVFTVVIDGEPEDVQPVRSFLDGRDETGEYESGSELERTQAQPAPAGTQEGGSKGEPDIEDLIEQPGTEEPAEAQADHDALSLTDDEEEGEEGEEGGADQQVAADDGNEQPQSKRPQLRPRPRPQPKPEPTPEQESGQDSESDLDDPYASAADLDDPLAALERMAEAEEREAMLESQDQDQDASLAADDDADSFEAFEEEEEDQRKR